MFGVIGWWHSLDPLSSTHSPALFTLCLDETRHCEDYTLVNQVQVQLIDGGMS